MKNNEIREEIKAANLRFWQVAEKFGLNDGNFSRKLRHELSDMDKAKIRAIIVELSKEVNDNALSLIHISEPTRRS